MFSLRKRSILTLIRPPSKSFVDFLPVFAAPRSPTFGRSLGVARYQAGVSCTPHLRCRRFQGFNGMNSLLHSFSRSICRMSTIITIIPSRMHASFGAPPTMRARTHYGLPSNTDFPQACERRRMGRSSMIEAMIVRCPTFHFFCSSRSCHVECVQVWL